MIYIFILLDSQKIFFVTSKFRSPKLERFQNKSGIWHNTNL
uniref:Uncharacterized protein n=1 Tax=Myoviridae sp. ctqEN1 TaxID=2827709 RepID=A0A8S5S5W7_9CAUD|nr:MAG TPA: hypothetical protein [Myoviridae sp. ctqEN1]DAX96222.1 MAG TPA: hypothetical protein [Bacteriophage sp.]